MRSNEPAVTRPVAAGQERPDRPGTDQAVAARTPGDDQPVDGEGAALQTERDFCLRSIRDLDEEYAAGDLDEADYQSLRDTYTARAATILRTLAGEAPAAEPRAPDDETDPEPPAEDDVRTPGASGPGGPAGPSREARRRWRRTVIIVAGIALAAAIAGWAVAASSGSRLPGQPVSGQSLGAETTEKYLSDAQAAADKGDYLTAVKDYQKVLDAQPNQPEALTGEGWVLAQTQQPNLLKQGLGMLAAAEQASPDYAPAHVYRGIALLSEGDYAGAVPELKWYLAHQPDPQLEPRVRQALQQAEAKVGAEGPAPTTTAPAA
jgi:tetratricopeptide (TPR) repeat protein